MNHNKHNMSKWMSLVCVVAPILAVLLLISNLGGGNFLAKILPYGLFLICPISMLIMMPLMNKFMNHGNAQNNTQSASSNDDTKPSCH